MKKWFFTIKIQLEDTTNTQQPKTLESAFSLQEEIDYLWEENHAKTKIIKQLMDMKVTPSNINIATGTCSSKVASTHIYCVNSI